jgi:hypothetical protein
MMASTEAPHGARRRAVQSWHRAVPGEREAPWKRGREGGRYNPDLAQTFVAATFAAASDSCLTTPGKAPYALTLRVVAVSDCVDALLAKIIKAEGTFEQSPLPVGWV